MKNSRNIIGGLAIIAFAVCILLERLGTFAGLPIFKLGVLALLVVFFFDNLKRLEFFGMSLVVGIGAWLFRDELNITQVSGPLLILVAALIGIGLNMIFGKNKSFENWHKVTSSGDGAVGGSYYESDDGEFDVDNNMGSKTEYIKINNLKSGRIDNSMGQLTVYLNGSTIDANGAIIDMSNGLGNIKLYIPREFRVRPQTENGLGSINFHGNCAQDESLPVLTLKIDNGLGSVDVFFE